MLDTRPLYTNTLCFKILAKHNMRMKCKMTFKLAQQLKYLVVNMLKCVSDLED